MAHSDIVTFRFPALRIDNFTFFTNKEFLQVSGTYFEDGRLRVCTFRLSYTLLNDFCRQHLERRHAFELMSAIGQVLGDGTRKWVSLNVRDIIGARVLIEGLGIISDTRSAISHPKPLIHSFFRFNTRKIS